MKTLPAYLIGPGALLLLLLGIGCSKRAQESSSAQSASDSAKPTTIEQTASEEDKKCEEYLKSAEIMEAQDWLQRYPKSLFSSHNLNPDNPNGTPLAPIVTRLKNAGAERVVIRYGTLGKGHVLIGVIVALPVDQAARQKVFAIEPELSQLCEQRSSTDHGQKYLYYSME